MHLVIGDRQSGKTTDLIKIAAERGGYIVCRTKSMCGEVMNMARKMELQIAFPLTYEEFLSKRYYGKGIKEFYIDDAEVFLQSMSAVPIYAISMGGDRSDGR